MTEEAVEAVEELEAFNKKVASGSSSRDSGDFGSPTPPAADCAEVEEQENKNPVDARMWAVNGHNYLPCDQAVDILEPGQYTVAFSQSQGFYFRKSITTFDELLHLPDSASEAIVDEIRKFWTKEQHFRDFGFLWKRGFLLWGPAGSGKTCTVQIVSQEIIKQGGIAVYVENAAVTAEGLAIFRRIEPTRPCVVIIEDLDAIVSQQNEAEVLALLDGELQIDNVVFIATTNYPERLDKRIVNRPSRFDTVKLIDMPNPAARRVYLSAKNKRLQQEEAASELDKWVNETDGFSIAHLKELIVSVEVFEVSFAFALKRLRTMMNTRPKSENAGRPGVSDASYA